MVCLLLVLSTGCNSDQQNTGSIITLSSCLRSLTNVNEFAVAPFGDAALESSCDKLGHNEDWAKWSQPDKDNLITMVDLKGPGCVTRIWMTSLQDIATEWQLFFDGEKTPRYRFNKADMFGKAAPFLPPLCDNVSGGFYCYMPMPFAKSFKIVLVVPKLTPEMRPYYQVNYVKYPKSTKVETFPAKLGNDESKLVNDVREAWSHTAEAAEAAKAACGTTNTFVVLPGQSVCWLKQDAPGTLANFWLSIMPPPDASVLDRTLMLRNLVLSMYWDGCEKPSVLTPVGDFFCNSMLHRRFAALPLAVSKDAFISRFAMPFRKSARAELRNDGQFPVTVSVGYDLHVGMPDARMRYFHATWNNAVSQGIPYCLLRVPGEGHLVGCYLVDIGMDGSWSIFEGNDMIWLNGEVTRSLEGTGVEDYFNGGWYYSGLFDLPLHGLVEKAPIRTSQYRFQLLDRVAFANGITFSFEFGEANKARGYMSSVAYWYAQKPTFAGYEVRSDTPRFPPADPLEPTAIICRLIELERLGHFDEASEVSRQYAMKFTNSPWRGIMNLRSEAYFEAMDGFNAASNSYQQVVDRVTEHQLKKQAENLLWFHAAKTNALFGINAFCRYRAYLDGVLVGEGDDPATLSVFPVTVNPGQHEIRIEITPTRRDPFFLLQLRCHTTNIVSDSSWEYVKERPKDWPSGPASDVNWKPVEQSNHTLPKMVYWQFVPNAYINMQAGTGIRPWTEWGGKDQVTAYLRKQFVISEE